MFEFDVNKSQSNLEKHGINFETALEMWMDERGLELPAKSESTEDRYMLIAKFDDKIWTAIFTRIEKNIRIISVRRARKNEREIYIG